MTLSRGSSKTGPGLIYFLIVVILVPPRVSGLELFFSHRLVCNHAAVLVHRLQYEARNQKKEAKEMAVIQAMKRREQQDQSDAAAQAAR